MIAIVKNTAGKPLALFEGYNLMLVIKNKSTCNWACTRNCSSKCKARVVTTHDEPTRKTLLKELDFRLDWPIPPKSDTGVSDRVYSDSEEEREFQARKRFYKELMQKKVLEKRRQKNCSKPQTERKPAQEALVDLVSSHSSDSEEERKYQTKRKYYGEDFELREKENLAKHVILSDCSNKISENPVYSNSDEEREYRKRRCHRDDETKLERKSRKYQDSEYEENGERSDDSEKMYSKHKYSDSEEELVKDLGRRSSI
ncbi:hypothetical protein O0L34_g17128 [Tuta absoluta]|nr:hypothetical protein O0L34_g17128 [Tuta absoluta]